MVKCVIFTYIFPVRNYLNGIFFFYHSVGIISMQYSSNITLSVKKENYTRRRHLKGYRQKTLIELADRQAVVIYVNINTQRNMSHHN